MKSSIKKITHSGELQIGDMKVPCYVTADGTSLLSSLQLCSALKIVDESFFNGLSEQEKELKAHEKLQELVAEIKTNLGK